ncbi:MAG: fimbrillin family protein [Bacteroides sp.]|nr:fimbrillin family protein [Bacteroides sp.]
MNKNKLKGLAAYLLAAWIMTACNQEEHTVDTTPVAARFSAGMAGDNQDVTGQSRASGSTWNAQDSIGIFMVENGTPNVIPGSENVKYVTTDGTSTFTVAQGVEDIYFPVDETQKVDFRSYYPFRQQIRDLLYPVNVAAQENPAEIDLLYANSYQINTSGYDKTTPEVGLVFYHQLARLVLNTIPGEGLRSLAGMSVAVRGMNTEAKFNLSTGELSDYNMFANIPLKMITDGKTFEAILLPGIASSDDEWKFDFVLGTDIYTWEVPAGTEFEAGKEHTWTISVQKIPIKASAKIEPWQVGQGGKDVAE